MQRAHPTQRKCDRRCTLTLKPLHLIPAIAAQVFSVLPLWKSKRHNLDDMYLDSNARPRAVTPRTGRLWMRLFARALLCIAQRKQLEFPAFCLNTTVSLLSDKDCNNYLMLSACGLPTLCAASHGKDSVPMSSTTM